MLHGKHITKPTYCVVVEKMNNFSSTVVSSGYGSYRSIKAHSIGVQMMWMNQWISTAYPGFSLLLGSLANVPNMISLYNKRKIPQLQKNTLNNSSSFTELKAVWWCVIQPYGMYSKECITLIKHKIWFMFTLTIGSIMFLLITFYSAGQHMDKWRSLPWVKDKLLLYKVFLIYHFSYQKHL